MKYKQKEKVLVTFLGDDKEYRAEIRGIASRKYNTAFYIVKMIDFFRNNDYEYDCAVISEHCLKMDTTKYKDDYGCHLNYYEEDGPFNNCVLDNDNTMKRKDCCICSDDVSIQTRTDCRYWREVR